MVPVPESLVSTLMAVPVGPEGRFWGVHRTTAWRWVRGVMLQVGIVGPMACCKGCRHGFGMRAAASNVPPNLIQRRSEEHTSELQSLMRISYAVFCLKKKNTA